MEPKIKVNNLSKIFGNNPHKALNLIEKGLSKDEIRKKTQQSVGVANVSFEVREGEILVIMGLSGSGKSTLIRCLNRLIEPTSGQIIIDGKNIIDLSSKGLREIRQKKFGMVFQHFALFPHKTVLQNAAFGLEIQGMNKKDRDEKAESALAQVGLADWGGSHPNQLSGGMQQRVGLARALAMDPDILLMDEAFSALDPLIRRDMQDELIDLQQRLAKTIVFISHDLDESLKLGDRIILMKDGRIVQSGTPEEILMSPANPYVARFVADVDKSKVLTAGAIMHKCHPMGYLRNDGPRAALHKMRQADISNLFVVSRDNTLQGIVGAEDAAMAVKEGVQTLEPIMKRDIVTVTPDTQAGELLTILKDLPYPLAVVNEDRKMAGIIVRGALIGALAE